MNFHITEDGPKKCKAQSPDKCPITKETGEPHYKDINVATKVYEEKMSNDTLKTFKKLFDNKVTNVGLPYVAGQSYLQGKKGNSYYGLTVQESLLNTHLDEWRKYVGKEQADKMEQAKIDRDGGYHFHATVLTPRETKALKKSGISVKEQNFDYSLTGIGTVSNEAGKEAWYITIDSPQIDRYRNSLQLGKHPLHATIGFLGGDIHDQSKDSSTRVII